MKLSEDYRCFTRDTTLTDRLTSCAHWKYDRQYRATKEYQLRKANRLNEPESEDKQLKQPKRRFVKSLRTLPFNGNKDGLKIELHSIFRGA